MLASCATRFCWLERMICWVLKFKYTFNPLTTKSTTALKEKKELVKVKVMLLGDLSFIFFISIKILSEHPWVGEMICS
jgi:hypothetical protein